MKKTFLSALLCPSFCFSSTAFAYQANAESQPSDATYVVINGEYVVCEGTNWENPETGEYFRWIDNPATRSSGDRIKEFEFEIRASISSAAFTINGTAVNVYADADVRYYSDDRLASGCGNKKFTVKLKRGLWSKAFKGTVSSGVSGSVSGLTSGAKHTVEIECSDSLPDNTRLVGDGYIELA